MIEEGKISFAYHKPLGTVNSPSRRCNVVAFSRKKSIVFCRIPFYSKKMFSCLSRKTKKAQVGRMLGLKKRIKTRKQITVLIIKHLVMPPVLPVDFIGNESILKDF
jgi:hypothetical protein